MEAANAKPKTPDAPSTGTAAKAAAGLSGAVEALSQAAAKFTARGTFSAAEARLIGGRGKDERLVKASELSAKYAKRIAEAVERQKDPTELFPVFE